MSKRRVSINEKEFERLRRLEAETRARIVNFSAADNLPREQLYERGGDVHLANVSDPQPGRRRGD